MARAKTADEARDEFLDSVRNIAKYWAEQPNQSPQERCDGVAFSILSMIDGSTLAMPPIDLRLSPHVDDRAYCESQGENWFEPGQVINECALHELYFK